MKRLSLVVFILLLLISCRREDKLTPELPDMFDVVFEDETVYGRSLSEDPAVDRLLVDVYISGTDVPKSYSYGVRNGRIEDPIDIEFNEGSSYILYFWAQKSSDSVWAVKEGQLKDGVRVEYPQNLEAGDIASYDSYSATSQFTYPGTLPTKIVMKRNTARIDFASMRSAMEEMDISEVLFTVEGLQQKITVPGSISEGTSEATLRFSSEDLKKSGDFNGDSRISHLGSLYLPVDGESAIDLKMTLYGADGREKGMSEWVDVTIESGLTTALIFDGAKVIWKGVQSDVVPSRPRKDGWIPISRADEFAALMLNGGRKGAKYHICNDLDMSVLPENVAKDIKSDALFESICVDGGVYDDGLVPADYKMSAASYHTVSDMIIPNASGIFAEVSDFEASNIAFDNIAVGGGDRILDGTGVFIGRSSGDLFLKNVYVSNSHVTAPCKVGGLVGALYDSDATINNCDILRVTVNTSFEKEISGQAGGLIGYIGRSSEEDRSIEVDVEIFQCDIHETTINAYMQSATSASGRLLGTLSGFDNGEKVSIVQCLADNATEIVPMTDVNDDLASEHRPRYVNAMKSDFCPEIPSKYEDLVGGQVYHRGLVRFGNYLQESALITFVPKWDGMASVAPLLADPEYDGEVEAGPENYMVYSPADLVGIRNITTDPKAIYFNSSVDMNGQGEDGIYDIPSQFADSYQESDDDNVFRSFKSVRRLEGNGHKVHNLSIHRPASEMSAFILTADSTTVHRNIDFHNCCVVGTNTQVDSNSTAYGAVLCADVHSGSYTMENVNAYDCSVFAVQKIGTLVARLAADTSYVANCTVKGSYIENYEVFVDEIFIGSFSYQDYTISAVKNFYPHGEAGGFIGFLQGNSTIENCQVLESTINCFGLDDVDAEITPAYMASVFGLMGYYHVPGRHVSTFIGDIRTVNAETIKLNDCSVDTKTECTNRWDKFCWTNLVGKHNTYPYLGSCYFVAFLDREGSLYIDGNRIDLADCRRQSVCYLHNK